MAGTIYYVGEFKFPEGQAASYRVLGNAHALRAAGFPLVVVGLGDPHVASPGQCVSNPASPYFVVDEYGPYPVPRYVRAWRSLWGGRRLVAWLDGHGSDAQAVILAGGYARYLLRLLSFTRRRGIPLVSDVVDWYEPAFCRGGRFGPQRWDVEWSLRRLIPKAGNVIAVSSFLEGHFAARGVHVIRVPPLVDTRDPKWAHGEGPPAHPLLRIGFAGTAGRKDLVVNALRGVSLLGNHANQFELLLIGPSADEVRKNLGPDAALLDALAGNVHFAGCLPHRQALAEMARVDFSILLRPNLRFAQAGFPTKLVESLALGVPVICNLTSDIGRYVHDGREGIIVRDSSPDAFAEGLRRVLAMTPAQRQDLRHQARRAAEACFDYRNWVDPLGKFIHEALGRQH